jgi:bromodomain-containing factor 1
VKNYYEKIKTPMDLEQITDRVNRHAYHSRRDFLADMELIYSNSCSFNGPENEYREEATI